MSRARFLAVVLCVALTSCAQKKAPPSPRQEPTPPRPTADEAFVKRAIHPEAALANAPVVADIAPQAGEEALLVTIRPGGHHELAVVRGDHKVLARAPLGGSVLANANIRRVGPFKALEFPGIKDRLYVLPVETELQRQGVCGLLLVRYRNDTLSLLAELATRCWSKKAGAAADIDPHSLYTVKQSADGVAILETQEEKVFRPHKWDTQQYAFVPLPPRKRK